MRLDLTRPIVGIENRTAQEVFDIMCARITASLAAPQTEPGLPPYPEDFEYAALLRNHDRKQSKWVVVPEGQSLDYDEGSIRRRWLDPHLGTDWHLFMFVRLAPAKEKPDAT